VRNVQQLRDGIICCHRADVREDGKGVSLTSLLAPEGIRVCWRQRFQNGFAAVLTKIAHQSLFMSAALFKMKRVEG
jgi:hypothetical protein